MFTASIIFENAGAWPITVLVLVALTAILLWFYPPQIHEIGAFGWFLPALRWCGLGVLAVMLLRPVIAQPAENVSGGQVLAIVDTSRSMGLVDTARTPAERVALARAFGMLMPDAADNSAARFLSQTRELDTFARNVVGAQNDLGYARMVGRGASQKQATLKLRVENYTSAVQKLVDLPSAGTGGLVDQVRLVPSGDSRPAWAALLQKIHELEAIAVKAQTRADENLYLTDPRTKKTCDDLSNQTRLSLALKALNVDRAALSGESSDLRTFGLGKSLEPLQTGRRMRGADASPVPLSSSMTDIPTGIGIAESMVSEQSARAIVLLTDGHHGGRRGDIASAVRPSGVPVYTVNVAARRVTDAWISSISLAANEVFRGQAVEGQVEVRSQGNVAPPKQLTVQAGESTAVVSLQARLGTEGRPTPGVSIGRFSIVVSPPPGAVDQLIRFSMVSDAMEATSENNSATRWIKVYPNKVRLTIVSGGPTWDVQNLQHVLQRMPWIELNSIVLPTPDGTLKTAATELAQNDILVLHDVPVHALSPGQWDAVGRAVSDRGGSVIVIAATSATLSEYAQQPLAAELLPFHDLQPVWRQWQGDSGAFRFSPTPFGLGSAMSVGDSVETARRWAETQSTFRYLQIPDKNIFSDVSRMLVESDSGSPVITERRRGTGRVIFIGLDELWRWGSRGGEPFDRRIWQQIVRYATGKRSAIRTQDFEFDLDRIALESGQSTTVRAWLRNAPAALKTIVVEVQSPARPPVSINLAARGGGRFDGRVPSLEPGDYTLRLRLPGRARGRNVDPNTLPMLPLHVLGEDSLGFVDLASDTALLDRISQSSGGRSLSIDQIDELPRLLREVRVEDSQLARRPIYSSPMLMVFVLACLSAEWALRKRAGLA